MYAVSRGPRPFSLGASLLISGAIISALVFVSPDFVKAIKDPPLVGKLIPIPPDPPPVEPVEKPKVETPRDSRIVAPDPPIRAPDTEPTVRTSPEVNQPPPTPFVGKPEGTGEIVTPPLPPAPLPPLIAATTDPRFARDFQPDYPAGPLRLGQEAVFKVRVRIGTDGRVKAIEQMGSSPAPFWEATRRHALARWRFKPATRGGVPEESWKVMNVRFELNE
jgi:protein TonB